MGRQFSLFPIGVTTSPAELPIAGLQLLFAGAALSRSAREFRARRTG